MSSGDSSPRRHPRQTTSPSGPFSTQQRLHTTEQCPPAAQLFCAASCLCCCCCCFCCCCCRICSCGGCAGGGRRPSGSHASSASASASSMQNERDRASCSDRTDAMSPLRPWHWRMQIKHVCARQPSHWANESRSDFLVGRRWQMWHGAADRCCCCCCCVVCCCDFCFCDCCEGRRRWDGVQSAALLLLWRLVVVVSSSSPSGSNRVRLEMGAAIFRAEMPPKEQLSSR